MNAYESSELQCAKYFRAQASKSLSFRAQFLKGNQGYERGYTATKLAQIFKAYYNAYPFSCIMFSATTSSNEILRSSNTNHQHAR